MGGGGGGDSERRRHRHRLVSQLHTVTALTGSNDFFSPPLRLLRSHTTLPFQRSKSGDLWPPRLQSRQPGREPRTLHLHIEFRHCRKFFLLLFSSPDFFSFFFFLNKTHLPQYQAALKKSKEVFLFPASSDSWCLNWAALLSPHCAPPWPTLLHWYSNSTGSAPPGGRSKKEDLDNFFFFPCLKTFWID